MIARVLISPAADVDWQDDEGEIREEEPSLERQGRGVVQQPGEPGFAGEKQLAGEKDVVGKFPRRLLRQSHHLGRQILANGDERFGGISAAPRPLRIALGPGRGVIPQCREFGRALEVTGIDHAHREKDKVAKGIAEDSRHMQCGVQAEPVETVDEHHGRAGIGVEIRQVVSHEYCRRHDGARAGAILYSDFRGLDDPVEPSQLGGDAAIVALDRESGDDKQTRDE